MEDGAMPKEVIAASDSEQLVVSWTKHDDLDPLIAVGSWKKWEDPNGTTGGWDPVGPQWAISREGADKMINVLRRARDQVYDLKSAEAPNINIHIHGSVNQDPKDFAAIVQSELRKLGRRGQVYGVGSDHD